MTAHTKWHDIDLGTLSDRELLLLAVQRVNDLAAHVENQNGRVSKLERWNERAIGVLLLVTFGVPIAISVAMSMLTR